MGILLGALVGVLLAQLVLFARDVIVNHFRWKQRRRHSEQLKKDLEDRKGDGRFNYTYIPTTQFKVHIAPTIDGDSE